MKRWTLKLALCLLAGAVVTWAVAWGCALWGGQIDLAAGGIRKDPNWDADLPAKWRSDQDEWYYGFNGWRSKRAWVSEDADGGPISVDVETFGWPRRALSTHRVAPGPEDRKLAAETGLMAPTWLHPAYPYERLPIELMTLGFALDTLLFAGVVLGVVEGVGFARRRRRLAKGRCPSCGYDRRGLAGDAVACPECGEAA